MPTKKKELNQEKVLNKDTTLNVNLVNKNLQITPKSAFSSLISTEIKPKLLAQVIRAEMSNLRTSGAHVKTRDEVRGGGKKPWKQKGTGRARHGSTRSPLWVGGGVTHGPSKNINWHQIITKSMRISALKSIFKDRLIANNVYQINDQIELIKTKQAEEFIAKLLPENKSKRQLLIYTTDEKPQLLGFANLDIKKINAEKLRIYQLANSQNWILTPKAKELLEARFEKLN